MNGLNDRRAYVEACLKRPAWRERAAVVAKDIRIFAHARKADGAPYPAWALNYNPLPDGGSNSQ